MGRSFLSNCMFPIHKRHGAYYPHWTQENGIYFVTYRLAGSVASVVFDDLELRRKDIIRTAAYMGRSLSSHEEQELESLYFKMMTLLSCDRGAKFLKNPVVANVVADAFRYFDGERYTLFAWVVMSNHVHVILQPHEEWQLPQIIHSWKSFTARKANKILGRTGAFWQTEYYDHLIRHENDLYRCIAYTWENPEKAGLRAYKWRWKRSRVECPFVSSRAECL